MRYLSLAAFLLAFWLVLSGHYTPMLITAGALLRGAITYFPWLIIEIALNQAEVGGCSRHLA
jgi:multicomponent Na+:H+ antiporter subunit E